MVVGSDWLRSLENQQKDVKKLTCGYKLFDWVRSLENQQNDVKKLTCGYKLFDWLPSLEKQQKDVKTQSRTVESDSDTLHFSVVSFAVVILGCRTTPVKTFNTMQP